MIIRCLSIVLCVGVLFAAVWIGKPNAEARKGEDSWIPLASAVYRSPGAPAGYAVVVGEHALRIDAPCGVEGLKSHGVRKSMPYCCHIIIAIRPPSRSASWPMVCRSARCAPRPIGYPAFEHQ